MYLSSTGTVAFASGGAIKAYVGANEFRVYHKIENADGTAADPAYSFASDTNTGFYRPAADRFALTAGGSVYLSSEIQNTYGYLKITENAGGTVATLGTTSWSRTWYMGKNLRYNKTAATSSPYDRLNWEYISGDTSSSQMGSLLISGSNGIAAWDFYAVPITTGAGVIPASFTRICRIATNGTDSTGGQIQMTSGADSAPSYSFTNDPDTGVYLPVSGSIGFATASTLRATIGSGQFSFGTDWVDNTSTGVDQFQIGNLSGDWGILGRVGSGNSFYITAADSNTTKLSRIKIGTTGNLEDNTANPALNWSSTALTVYKDIVMSGNETHDIGSTTNRVNDLWASYYYVKRENDHPVVQGIRDDSTITNVDHLLHRHELI
jgi:hypothetical protein